MNHRKNEDFRISDVCLFQVISSYKRKSDTKRLKRSSFTIKKICHKVKSIKRENCLLDDNLSICEYENSNHTNKANGFTFDRLVSISKGNLKRYTVSVNYVDVTDEVRKIKRAIIEDILKKS